MKQKRRVEDAHCAVSGIQLSVCPLVFPVSDAGRIVTVTIRVTNLTVAPMDHYFGLLTLSDRNSPVNRRSFGY